MSFWRILKCIFRRIISFDPRPHTDDVYDDHGNAFILGPWLDQAIIVFDVVLVLLGIIVFVFSFLDNANRNALLWVFISSVVLFPPLLSAVYVAIKRAVFLKKQKQQKDD